MPSRCCTLNGTLMSGVNEQPAPHLGPGIEVGVAAGIGERLIDVDEVPAVPDHRGRAEVDELGHALPLAGLDHMLSALHIDRHHQRLCLGVLDAGGRRRCMEHDCHACMAAALLSSLLHNAGLLQDDAQASRLTPLGVEGQPSQWQLTPGSCKTRPAEEGALQCMVESGRGAFPGQSFLA